MKNSQPEKVTTRRMCWSGIGLLVIYLLLAAITTQTLHFSRALDEGYHLEYVTFIKQNGHLPTSFEERAEITRADFPPLYHLLVAILSARVDVDGPPNFKLFWDSFRYRVIDHQAQQVWTLDTEDYQPPYFGRFLVWQIGRWISISLSLATVVVVYFTLLETPLARIPAAPLAGAALLAFLPRYIILGSSLNDDNLLGLVAALYFLMLVKAIKNPQRWWPFVAMGILLGVSMTVKYTLVVVPLEIVAVSAWLASSGGYGWRWFWPRISTVGLLALVCSSWWFGWNIWFLNTVAEDGWLTGLVRPLLAGGNDTTLNRVGGLFSGGQVGLTGLPEETVVGTFPEWIRSTFVSFWGMRIGDSVPLAPYIYPVIGLMLAGVVVGLWRLWQGEQPESLTISSHISQKTNSKMLRMGQRHWLALFIFHVGIFFILPLLRFWLTRRLSVAAQGRHILIPAAAAVVGLLVWGLATAIPKRWQRMAFAVVTVGLLGWTGVHIYQLANAEASPLPMRTIPQAAEWLPNAVQAQFGETAELASYELVPHPEQGLLRLGLAWRALAHTNQSYRLKVNVVDAEGAVVSHWTGYNGQGRLPTLAWDPGDAIFDRLALPLPNLPAGTYELRVQMLNRTGEALPVSLKNDGQAEHQTISSASASGEFLLLDNFSLSDPATLTLPWKMTVAGPEGPVELGLWQAEGPVTDEGQLADKRPTYRYPGTISVVVSESDFGDGSLDLQLIDPADQTRTPTQREAGIYTFIIGPRWPSGQYRLRLALQQGDQIVGQATSEPLLAVINWWERRFEPPEIAVPKQANFANEIMFLGYKLPQAQVEAGQAFPVTLYWQAPAHRPPQADFIQYNNLVNSNGEQFGGYDRQPLEYYSTLLWAPGEVVVDGYAVPVEADAPPGEYYLDVGYYLTVGESAVNLPLVVDGEMTEKSSVTLGPIEVVESQEEQK